MKALYGGSLPLGSELLGTLDAAQLEMLERATPDPTAALLLAGSLLTVISCLQTRLDFYSLCTTLDLPVPQFPDRVSS